MAVARADATSGGRGACIKLSLAKAPAFPSMFPMATSPPVRRQCLGGRPAGGSEKIVRLPAVLFGPRVGPTAPELGGLMGMSAAGATTHVFESVVQRAVVTSTFVERCFAALTRFSKPPQSCATLAAKHTNATFAQIVEQWRASQGVCAHEQTRVRPAWMRTRARGSSKNGYHVFVSEMRSCFEEKGFHDARATLSEQWWALPAETRSDYSQRAASIRRRARCCESPLDSMLSGKDEVVEGPCGVASREGPFPIRPHALAEYLCGPGSTQRVASEWRQAPME